MIRAAGGSTTAPDASARAPNPTGSRTLESLLPLARRELRRASELAGQSPATEGMPGTAAEGRLIRPLVALAALDTPESTPPGFWSGVLAIQLAHEASLVHDDVVDGAAERRGRPTIAAHGGVAKALVRGDHLLTAAYRAAAATGSMQFVTLFARAVERTVAGEAAQGTLAGGAVTPARYREIALGKAGELIGCALAVAPVLEGRRHAAELFEAGRGLGLLYQMLDDLLDYCPSAVTGKPALGDYGQQRWTWVLEEAPDLGFASPAAEAVGRLHDRSAGSSAMDRCLERLEREANGWLERLTPLLPGDTLLEGMVSGWVEAAGAAVEAEAEALRAETTSQMLSMRLPALAAADGYLATHSRSFRFASRFFPADDAARVARVYAFCRCTDDLVDRPCADSPPEALLDAWLDLSRRAYDGGATGLPLLDRVMGEMSAAGVPFDYAAALVEGMRMDLRGGRFATAAELRGYTHRVASVVGLWMTRLFGVDDPVVLARAERMGHAMQLTNILRDVGEDWGRGRLYLPLDRMAEHGVGEDDIAAMSGGGPLSDGYRALVEALLLEAEAEYAAALEAVPALPPALARPVAVAAYVYRGIHGRIRRNGYDNLRLRAYTSPLAKGRLAARAIWWLAHSGPDRALAGVAAGHAVMARAGDE